VVLRAQLPASGACCDCTVPSLHINIFIYTLSYFHYHMFSKAGTKVGYGSVPGGVFTGGKGIVIILVCDTNITCCVCVTCTYSGVDLHPDHSHHTFMFHKDHGKRASQQYKVTDRTGMEAYHWCSHGCIWHYTVNISIYGTEL